MSHLDSSRFIFHGLAYVKNAYTYYITVWPIFPTFLCSNYWKFLLLSSRMSIKWNRGMYNNSYGVYLCIDYIINKGKI